MTDNTLFKQISALLSTQLAILRKEIKDSQDKLKTELKSELKKELKTEIVSEIKVAMRESKEDTIAVLKELIETGYNMHEKRIKRVEDHLHLPPLQ